MDARLEKLLRKLDRPPSAPNWVRFIHDDELKTARAIVSFVMGQPPFNYQPSYAVIRDRIEIGISREAAVQAAATKGAPAGRPHNVELVHAFFDFDEERRYSAQNPIGFESGHFLVSREVRVPVSPLSVIREQGRFVPISVCGWNTNPLTDIQRRLLMTVLEDGFLSLTDFQDSPAEFLFFPRTEIDGKQQRIAEKWSRGDYELLGERLLNEQVQIFLLGRELARKILLEKWEKPEASESRDESDKQRTQRDLFDR